MMDSDFVLADYPDYDLLINHGAKDAPLDDDREQERETMMLPGWTRVSALDPPPRNKVLVHDVLRLGHVGLIAGKGKAGKSWAAIQLSIAIACGGEWLGFKCEQGTVLYIDPEIDYKSLDNRFAIVCRSLGINPAIVENRVAKWSLRGIAEASMSAIVHDLQAASRPGQFSLVVIDSASVFVEGDENSSLDIRRFAAKVLQVAEATGASVLLVHHFGKGNAGDRDVADRARGSSVWLDFPDATLYLTEIFPPSGEVSDYLDEGSRAFVLETGGMREFPAFESRHLVFAYPAHRIDEDGTTDGWKPRSAQAKGGKTTGEANKQKSANRASKCELAIAEEFIARNIGDEGLAAGEAAEIVSDALGETVKTQTLKTYIETSEMFAVEQVSPQRWRVVMRRKKPSEPSGPRIEQASLLTA